MSYVTNIILHLPICEEEKIEEVNKFFDEKEKGLVSLDDGKLPHGWYGGSKMLEANLYAGAFNYLSLEELMEYLRKIDWENPEEVQVMVKEQNDEVFRIELLQTLDK
jgi:hypothetical protein